MIITLPDYPLTLSLFSGVNTHFIFPNTVTVLIALRSFEVTATYLSCASLVRVYPGTIVLVATLLVAFHLLADVRSGDTTGILLDPGAVIFVALAPFLVRICATHVSRDHVRIGADASTRAFPVILGPTFLFENAFSRYGQRLEIDIPFAVGAQRDGRKKNAIHAAVLRNRVDKAAVLALSLPVLVAGGSAHFIRDVLLVREGDHVIILHAFFEGSVHHHRHSRKAATQRFHSDFQSIRLETSALCFDGFQEFFLGNLYVPV